MNIKNTFELLMPNGEKFTDEIKHKLNNPEFEKSVRVHDWRNYVHEQLKNNWIELTERERKIIFIVAETQSDMEEWD